MTTPPKYFLQFFRWFCHPELQPYIEGDLVELYNRSKKSGEGNANWKFRWEVLKLLRPGIIRPVKGFSTTNNIIMYSSYFKIAWRNLLKNKAYSSINIVGLAAGMTVAILIGLWIADELSFDSYFKNHERLAEVMSNQSLDGQFYTGASIAPPVADPLRTQFAGDFKALALATFSNDYVIANGENKLSAKGMWVQKDFPVMFTLEMISGRQDALKDPSTILISQSMARSLFGDSDPINKSVHIDKTDMNVGGVFNDLPDNTTFAGTGLLLSWDNPENGTNRVTDWSNHTCQLFVQLADRAVAAEVTEKIKSLPTPHIKGWHEEILIHPLDQLHLYSKFTNGKVDGGRIKFVWLFGIIGGFVLLLACINFMNLSTARSEKRAKEVGIRKSIGSIRGQLIGQFLSESMVMVGLAFVLSLVLAQLSLPFFNLMADKKTSMPWTEPTFWLLSLGFTFFTGLVSGSYPAFYLSAFKPIQALKGALKTGRLALIPRKVLVVLQFTVSITLIIGTMVVFRQIQHAKNRVPGYSREGLITVKMNTPGLRDHYEALRNDLIQSQAAENVSRASQSPSNFNNNNGLDWKGKDPGLVVFFRNVNVTPEFGKTIGWTIKEGRDFSEEFRGDSASIILSEEALKITGLKNPVGEVVKFRDQPYTIVGIVKDMVTQSPYEPMAPSMFFAGGWRNIMVIKLNPAAPIQESLAAMTPIFAKHNPEGPFEFSFVDETFAKKFANEERVGNLAGVFAVLAILISCLGLFGLSSFVAEQRTKEIGIRKVLGASVTSLWQMLSKDFVVLILISCAISVPLSIWFMGDWLGQFEYHTTITWTVFAIACLGALMITLLTVSFQAIKAAVANPVNSLKTE